MPANYPKKWFLDLCMAFSDILRRCSPVGTNSWVSPFALNATLYYFSTSLSNTCFLVPNPAVFIHIITFLHVFNICYSVMLRVGSEKI